MSIRCIRNASGIYGKYSIYTKYEIDIDSGNIDDIYELLYNNIQVRNEIICCNENGGCSYYTSGDIHTSLYIKCNFSCDYDVINNKIYDSNVELKYKHISTNKVILANISFELFKNIICFFKDTVLGIYDKNILELFKNNNKYILNMRSECYDYVDSDTDTDTDTSVDIEPL